MKKILFVVSLSGLLVLSACGGDNESNNDAGPMDGIINNNDEKAIEENEQTMTDDPVEVVTNDEIETFSGSSDNYDITRYTSDNLNDEGFIELEKEGYEIKFSVVAGESEFGDEDMIFVVGEQENTNEDGGEMQMNQYKIETSEGEKLEDGWNFSEVEGGIKDKVANEFELEYDIPDEIELHVESIYDEDADDAVVEEDDGGIRENQHEVDKTFTFTKE